MIHQQTGRRPQCGWCENPSINLFSTCFGEKTRVERIVFTPALERDNAGHRDVSERWILAMRFSTDTWIERYGFQTARSKDRTRKCSTTRFFLFPETPEGKNPHGGARQKVHIYIRREKTRHTSVGMFRISASDERDTR